MNSELFGIIVKNGGLEVLKSANTSRQTKLIDLGLGKVLLINKGDNQRDQVPDQQATGKV